MSSGDLISGNNDLVKLLENATKNLYYTSETDAEIVPFIGQPAVAVTKDEILRQIGEPFEKTIEERDFAQIFERLTTIQDWFGKEETATAEKFAALRDLLVEKLVNLKVFKIGRVELDLYFVGLDRQGRLIGVKTKAVET